VITWFHTLRNLSERQQQVTTFDTQQRNVVKMSLLTENTVL